MLLATLTFMFIVQPLAKAIGIISWQKCMLDIKNYLMNTESNPTHITEFQKEQVDPTKKYWVRFGGTKDPWGRTVQMGGTELITKIEYLELITGGNG